MAGYATANAFRIKEMLRWVRQAETKQAARWRSNNFLRVTRELIGQEVILKPVRTALETFEEHLARIIHRWESLLCTARLEGLNNLFQVARAKARGYRNTMNFVMMIYLRTCLETSAFIVTRRHVDKKGLRAAAKTREDCQTIPK